MDRFTWPVSKILTVELETSSRAAVDLFRTRFADLYDGELDPDRHTTVVLREVPDLKLPHRRLVREITIPEYAVFDDDHFYVVRGRKRAAIPFADIGRSQRLEVVFEAGFPPDWLRRLLDDLLAFHVVGFGLSFVHAACLQGPERDVIIPAWRGTGKTHLAIRLLTKRSYAYKAEDQFFIDADGNSYLYTDACHVDPKHMKSFPEIKKRYHSFRYSLRVSIAKIMLPLLPPINAAFEFARRVVLKLFHPKVYVKMSDFVPGFRLSHEQRDRAVVLQLVTAPDARRAESVEVPPDEMAGRALGGMQYERIDLYPFYYAWVYATGLRNEVIDTVHEAEAEILAAAFSTMRCHEVRIPVEYDWDGGDDLLDDLLGR